jgi:tRNA G18 (ribose-2'-O)-methylase SpoU
MPLIPIDSLDDPRVNAFRNLKDRELERRGQRFIAEGEHIVRRLLQSSYPTESLLLTPRRAAEITDAVPANIPQYVVDPSVMNEILGLKFHSGILACGVRKPRAPLRDIIPINKPDLTLVICPEISNVENIGSIIRLSAGFGADALILGEKCHDPFWRQSIRVSMGTIFTLPLVRCMCIADDLRILKSEYGVELAATVIDATAEPLQSAKRSKLFGLLLGSEAQGLEPQYVEVCDRKICIPMHWGTDSLNVSVAAGIFLYHFTSDFSKTCP